MRMVFVFFLDMPCYAVIDVLSNKTFNIRSLEMNYEYYEKTRRNKEEPDSLIYEDFEFPIMHFPWSDALTKNISMVK